MADNLESRASKVGKVVKAGVGLTAFVAGWRFDLWYVDDAMMLAGAYLMYKGRDTIDYIKAYRRNRK